MCSHLAMVYGLRTARHPFIYVYKYSISWAIWYCIQMCGKSSWISHSSFRNTNTHAHVGPNIVPKRSNDLLPIERDILNLTISQQQYTKCDSWTTYCSGFEHYDKTEHVNTFQRLSLSRHTNYIADLYSSGFRHEANFIHFLFRALIVFSEEKCVKKTLCLDKNMQIKKFSIFNAFLVQSSPLQLTQRLTSCIKGK